MGVSIVANNRIRKIWRCTILKYEILGENCTQYVIELQVLVSERISITSKTFSQPFYNVRWTEAWLKLIQERFKLYFSRLTGWKYFAIKRIANRSLVVISWDQLKILLTKYYSWTARLIIVKKAYPGILASNSPLRTHNMTRSQFSRLPFHSHRRRSALYCFRNTMSIFFGQMENAKLFSWVDMILMLWYVLEPNNDTYKYSRHIGTQLNIVGLN